MPHIVLKKIKDATELVSISNRKTKELLFMGQVFLSSSDKNLRHLKRSCRNFDSIDVFSFCLCDTGRAETSFYYRT